MCLHKIVRIKKEIYNKKYYVGMLKYIILIELKNLSQFIRKYLYTNNIFSKTK